VYISIYIYIYIYICSYIELRVRAGERVTDKVRLPVVSSNRVPWTTNR
jgi:hypothetical protein